MTMRPCLECGEATEQNLCDDHRPSATAMRGSSPSERGYDSAWTRLSARARRMQPWCSDAHLGGCEGPLTADHLPSAWERKALGLPLRLSDVEVVCRRHNSARGSSRVGTARGSVLEHAGRD